MIFPVSTQIHSTSATCCPKPAHWSVLITQTWALSAGASTVPTSTTSLQSSSWTFSPPADLKPFPQDCKTHPCSFIITSSVAWHGHLYFPRILCLLRGAAITLAATASHHHLTFLPLHYRCCPSTASSHTALNEKDREQVNQTVTQSWQGAGEMRLRFQLRALAARVGFT